MNKKRLTLMVAMAVAMLPLSWAASSAKDKEDKEEDRLQNAGVVLKEILDVPDNIPTDLIDKARCVIVFPSVVKAAFVVGGSYGRGAMVCRTGHDMTGPWGAPTMMALEAGSVGFQIGGQATDFVILVMNNRGVDSLLHSKVKLGADVGRRWSERPERRSLRVDHTPMIRGGRGGPSGRPRGRRSPRVCDNEFRKGFVQNRAEATQVASLSSI
jgi:hypothetical protein